MSNLQGCPMNETTKKHLVALSVLSGLKTIKT